MFGVASVDLLLLLIFNGLLNACMALPKPYQRLWVGHPGRRRDRAVLDAGDLIGFHSRKRKSTNMTGRTPWDEEDRLSCSRSRGSPAPRLSPRQTMCCAPPFLSAGCGTLP